MEMKRQFLRSRKGILLTLVTIVLFLLMLSELITYVTFSINYDSLSTASSTTFSSSAFAATLTSQSAAWLHSSLYNALGALVKYEGTPTMRNGNFINNTALALKSLVTNGTVYGTNLNSTMGGATLKVWLNYTKLAGLSQNVNVSIKNSSIIIFQGGPFSLNATLTGLMIINSTYGVSTYPLSVTAGIPLNGTVSLYSAETADTSPIKAQANYPVAQLVGNTYAIKGSTSPFMFAYGTIVYEAGTPSCSAVPSGENNKNFILAAPSAIDIPQNACGMAGVITYTANTAGPQTPYLVYAATTNVLKLIQNGTSLLLDGKGLALYNLSQIQNAANNGYSYPSSYVPDFLSWGQNNFRQRSVNGSFSFSSLNRQGGRFNGTGSTSYSYLKTADPSNSINIVGPLSVSVWIDPFSANDFVNSGIYEQNSCNTQYEVFFEGGSLYFRLGANFGHDLVVGSSAFSMRLNNWYNIVDTWNGSYSTTYINGALIKQGGPYTNPITSYPNGPGYIGQLGNGCPQYDFNGIITDVQVYNGSLSSQQAYQLYVQGSTGPPVAATNGIKLAGWWPLNGNGNDYSGNNNNATLTSNVMYPSLYAYPGNPLLNGAYTNRSSINEIAGVLNCGTLNQCANSSLQHLYLSSSSLTGRYSSLVANFSGSGSFVNATMGLYYGENNPFTASTWVYLSPATNGPAFGVSDAPPGSWSIDFISVNGLTVYEWIWGVGSNAAISYTVPSSGWYNLVAYYSPGTGEILYVNGVNVASMSGAYSPSGQVDYWTTFNNGKPTGVNANMEGKVFNVQLYGSALTQPQIASLYQEGINGRPIQAANLTGWWMLNGSVTDYSGKGDNGRQTNVHYATQYFNNTNGTSTAPQAFHLGDAVVPNVANFDGIVTDNVVITKDSSWPAGSQPASIFAWVRSTQATTYPFIVNYGRAGTGYENWLLGWYRGSVEVDDWDNGVAAGPAINDGKWHFVGFTYAGGGTTTVTTYTDGTPTTGNFCSTCVPNVYTGSGSVANIGWGCCSTYFNGSIADVQIYNVSLTQAQVNQLYTNDSVIGVAPVAWFPLSSGYNGLLNETPNLAFPNNPGVLGSCTSSNVINGQCGIREVQP